MCGRYASFREAQDLADAFAIERLADDVAQLPPSWNVAPTDRVRIVVERPDAETGAVVRSLRTARWGLVPGWAKSPAIGSRMINARVETLVTKPAYRRALAARRCLVPAEGYYEWQAPELAPTGADARAPKQPYFIHPVADAPLAFAGLYEFWRDPARAADDPRRWLVTMTIITGDAEGDLRRLHDRQPVMLRPRDWDAWLDPALDDPLDAQLILTQLQEPVTWVPVSRAVNHVGANGPALIEPEAPAADAG